ncbi:unnamed protein product, partial [Meganyctiphanes norvegica]
MDLFQDSEGDHITIHGMQNSSYGTKIISNNSFLNNFSSSTDKTKPEKYADITAIPQNEKDTLLSLDEEEQNRIVNDMIEEQYSSPDHSAVENIQQNIFQEQVQLLESYNGIIDLPQDAQIQVICSPVDNKKTSDVKCQQFHKSQHLLPWLSEEYTKLIHPSKHCHVVTKKKKKQSKVNQHTNHTTMLPNDILNTDILGTDGGYPNNKCNLSEKEDTHVKTISLAQESKEVKNVHKKSKVSITRGRDVQKGSLQFTKVIPNKHKEHNPHNAFTASSFSSTEIINPKYNETIKMTHPNISMHPLQIQNELCEVKHLREDPSKISNEYIIIPQFPSIPVISSGEILETTKCKDIDNQKTDQNFMIQELQKMVPPSIYPQQSLKTFDNGNVLLVAPLRANVENHKRKIVKSKEKVFNIKSDIQVSCGEIELKDTAAVNLNDSYMYESISKQSINDTQNDTNNDFTRKRKNSDDSIKGQEKKKWQLEDEFSDEEEEKKRVNAIKAKEHREKKKEEIKAIKIENVQWQLKYKELEAENKQLKANIEM